MSKIKVKKRPCFEGDFWWVGISEDGDKWGACMNETSYVVSTQELKEIHQELGEILRLIQEENGRITE